MLNFEQTFRHPTAHLLVCDQFVEGRLLIAGRFAGQRTIGPIDNDEKRPDAISN
jgi:hypothetical protein